MELVIKNCNNIDEARINIKENCLNIKYGMNGTGKSTIVRAIELDTINEGDLSELMPFKHISNAKQKEKLKEPPPTPSIDGLDSIDSVSIFNEEYVNQFVFKQDEVVKNSFEIFIKTKEYDERMQKIEKLVDDIKQTFKNDESIEQVITDLTELSGSFGNSKSGIHGSGGLAKGIGKGNKLEHIPEQLKPYQSFLKMKDNVKWIGWQIIGNTFLEVSSDCPYCISPVEDKKETILSVGKEYNAKSIEHLNKLLEILENLGGYFSDQTFEKLNIIFNNKDGLSPDQKIYLIQVREQIDFLRGKLANLKDISYFSFKDDEDAQKRIQEFNIDLECIPYVNSDKTKSIADRVNKSLDNVSKSIGYLQGEITQQKQGIKDTIKKHKDEINNFLKYAGYEYYVDFEEDGDLYKMRLKHKDSDTSINNSSEHLSFGERNAFSLVLFMYESLAKEPDLIILDDPISSFDRTKKFAIIEMLFRRQESFRGKTVLMMTHDFEPIVDIVSTFHSALHSMSCASFFQNKQGVVTEIKVTKNDVMSFNQVCTENINSDKADIIKLIYLRRYYDILDNKKNEYQLLANLFKKRSTPIVQPDDVEMIQVDIDNASAIIKVKVSGFDYEQTLNSLNDNEEMMRLYEQTDSNYEKLQIFRIINDNDITNSVVQKFINETFHIENEYIMQLNPSKYDFIPQYVISECDEMLNGVA